MLVKIQLKTQVVNTARNILIMPNNLATDALKTAKIQKAAEAVVIYLEIILRIKLQKSQKLHERVIQNQMKKKYLEKDIYLQKKDRKLLMI